MVAIATERRVCSDALRRSGTSSLRTRLSSQSLLRGACLRTHEDVRRSSCHEGLVAIASGRRVFGPVFNLHPRFPAFAYVAIASERRVCSDPCQF